MLRICPTIVARTFLQPRILVTPPVAGIKKQRTIEGKLGLPERPKRPLTSYFRFLVKVRPVLANKYPDAKAKEIAKISADQWTKADPDLKHQMEEEYQKEKVEYDKKLFEYEQSLSSEQKELLLLAKDSINARREKKNLQKKMKDLGKPKRPCSPFMAYMIENPTRKEGEAYREYQVRLGKQWLQLDEKTKFKYVENFNKEMEVYQRELRNWEEKMIRLGNIEVVRNEVLIEPQEGHSRKALIGRKSK